MGLLNPSGPIALVLVLGALPRGLVRLVRDLDEVKRLPAQIATFSTFATFSALSSFASFATAHSCASKIAVLLVLAGQSALTVHATHLGEESAKRVEGKIRRRAQRVSLSMAASFSEGVPCPASLHGVHHECNSDAEAHVLVDRKKHFSLRGEVVEDLPVSLELQLRERSDALHEKAMRRRKLEVSDEIEGLKSTPGSCGCTSDGVDVYSATSSQIQTSCSACVQARTS